MSARKDLEPGLYRKPCGCQVVMAPGGQVLAEHRCEAEGKRRLNLGRLVPLSGDYGPEQATPQPQTIPLAQPMLTANEIAELQEESAETMREFRRQMQTEARVASSAPKATGNDDAPPV